MIVACSKKDRPGAFAPAFSAENFGDKIIMIKRSVTFQSLKSLICEAECVHRKRKGN